MIDTESVSPSQTDVERRIAEIGARLNIANDPAHFADRRAAVAMQLVKEDVAWLLGALHESRKDSERLDWLEKNAMREDAEAWEEGIRVERFGGSPQKKFTDAAFRVREWGEAAMDSEGHHDFGGRFYRHTDHATLRAAIDAARAGNGETT